MIRIKKEQDRDPRILTGAFPLSKGDAFFGLLFGFGTKEPIFCDVRRPVIR